MIFGPISNLRALLLSGLLLAMALPSLRADSLTRPECETLYEHQLKVASTDPSFPLAAVLGQQKQTLTSPSPAELQMEICLTQVSEENYNCQMKATSVRQLLECQERHKKAPVPSPSPKQESSPSTPSPSPGSTLEQGYISTSGERVTRGRCTQAYDHLLSVYSTFPALKEREDRARLLQYWRSREARSSFLERCVTSYKPEDLACILSTKDPDLIQGCLVQIPEPE